MLVEQFVAQFSDDFFGLSHGGRRECLRDQSAQSAMRRMIVKKHHGSHQLCAKTGFNRFAEPIGTDAGVFEQGVDFVQAERHHGLPFGNRDQVPVRSSLGVSDVRVGQGFWAEQRLHVLNKIHVFKLQILYLKHQYFLRVEDKIWHVQ